MRCVSVAATALLLTAVACRRTKPGSYVSGVRLDVSEAVIAAAKADTFKIGNVKNGETILKEFLLHNAGSQPFVFNVKSDCGCVVSRFEQKPVMPDESAQITISFDSRGYHGCVFKRVEILTTLDPKPLTIWLNAVVD